MPVITIPFDYDPQKHDEVPIFLNDTDASGETIFFGWIEAVVPVQEQLRSLARRVLQDVWRVSELADITVHNLWNEYRDEVGPDPSFRIYKRAIKTAHHLEDPGTRFHNHLNTSLDWLEEYQKDALIAADEDSESEFNRHLDVCRFERRLRKHGKRNELDVYRLLRAGYRWKKIGTMVGENPNTVYRRFRRLVQRITGVV